jgi:MYXO-CTERM domain-containing protein
VDDELTLGMGGTWARLHATEAGFWFFQVAGGDLWAEDVGDDLSGYDDRKRIQLTQLGKIQDSQIERCPDGGYLAVGSYTLDAFDDSAQAWRLESDFTERWHVTVAERDASQKHNDMVVVCTTANEGVMFAGALGGTSGAVYVPLDGGEVGADVDLGQVGIEGSSSAAYGADGASLLVATDGFGASGVLIRKFDTDWKTVTDTTVTLTDDRVIWPQRVQSLGDGWLLAYLTNPQNSPSGDVWLAAFDADFNLVDQVQVNSSGGQDNRPWLARKGTEVVVSYDRSVQPHERIVTLADGSGGADDGIVDTANPDGGGDGGADSAGDTGGADLLAGCACDSGGAPGIGGAALLAGLALVRRRR